MPASTPNNGTSILALGPTNASAVDAWEGGISGPATFNDGGYAAPSTGTGTVFGFRADTVIYLPIGYVSGSQMSSQDVYDNTTLGQLGLTSGTYTYDFGSGPNADSVVVQVGAPTPVPEPGTAAMLLFPVAGFVASWRARSKRYV